MKPWEFYDKNSDELFSCYISLTFDSIFFDVMEYFPESVATILDVGAGSGRDTAALAAKGHKVIAVEPSNKMRKLASEYYTSPNITWINDSLPQMSEIKKTNKKFDLILVSAVWMHLSDVEQDKSLETLYRLLSNNGKMIITLRLGPPEPERNINSVNTQHLINSADSIGLKVDYISPINNDSLNRPQIKWQKVVLSKPIQ